MIDAYKQVLVGQYQTPKAGVDVPDLTADRDVGRPLTNRKRSRKRRAWASTRRHWNTARKQAEIVSVLHYGQKRRADDRNFKGRRIHAAYEGENSVRIFRRRSLLSIKNIKGVEITGTNTMFEKTFLESVKAGQVLEITFRQKMRLQGGDYLISLGVTGYEKIRLKCIIVFMTC